MQAVGEPAKPGENGRWSLCPDMPDENITTFISSILPLKWRRKGKEPAIIDPYGLIYVLHEEEEEVRNNNDKKLPLVVRANVYDCVDYTLTSEWLDDDFTNFQSSKINIHPHFLQFDNQASDGVISGFSYEQSCARLPNSRKRKKGLPVPMNAKVTKAPRKATTLLRLKMPSNIMWQYDLDWCR